MTDLKATVPYFLKLGSLMLAFYGTWKVRKEEDERKTHRVRLLKHFAVILVSVLLGLILLAGTVKALVGLRILTIHSFLSITGSDLPALPNGPPNGSSLKHRVLAGRMTLPEAVEELEREIIEAAMFDANFRPTTAAARIGCNRRHLTYRIAKWQGRGHGQAA